MNPDFERVFYHELGHLIAHKLNSKLFGMGGVEEITIIEHLIKGKIYYSGATVPIKPMGFDPKSDTQIINLPEKAVELVYGCILQSLKLKTSLFDCFNEYNWCHGQNDFFTFTGGLLQYKKYDRKDEINTLFLNHLKDIEALGLFSLIDTIKVEYYIAKNEGIYYMDLNRIDPIIEPFILRIEELYIALMEKLKVLLDWKVK